MHVFFICSVSIIMSRLSTFRSRTLPDPTFFEPYDCYKVTMGSDTPFFFLWSLPSVETMGLCRSVMKDDILCELYADTYSDV